METALKPAEETAAAPQGLSVDQAVTAALGRRSLVFVGMMGAGKTSVGKRVAARLGLPFIDADAAIEEAAGMSILEIFNMHGEQHFRDGERRVILRLLNAAPQVVATGGGAFMNPDTRAAIASRGVSIWLTAGFDLLIKRVRRRANRPMLANPDPESVLKRLMAERYPVYAQADVTVESSDVPQDVMAGAVIEALSAYFAASSAASGSAA